MTIEISNPSFYAGQGSIIVLELADDAAALRVAHQIALDSGKAVRVRNAEMDVVGSFSAAAKQ
jgi:hypothetical protein